MNISYPFHFDDRGRTTRATYARHVRDMIEQLIFTSPGERVNRPDFGCGLLQLTFGPNSIEAAAVLQYTLQASLQRFLGDVIDVEDVVVEANDNILYVYLKYRILRTGEPCEETFERSA